MSRLPKGSRPGDTGHCSALSVSQFTRLHRKYLGKVTTWFFLVHPYSILLRYLLGHVPCIDMGEKTPAIYKHQEFWQKCHLQRDQVLRAPAVVVEVAIFKGMDSGTSWLMLMNFTTTFHQKTRNFPKGSILAEASMMNTAGKVRFIFNFNFVGFVHSSLCSRDFYFNGWFVFLLSEVSVDLHIG